MKRIPLSQDQFALVDDAYYDWLMQWKWCAQWAESTESFYAQRKVWLPNDVRTVLGMGRQILGLEYGDKRHADHKNSDTLDNQRHNLRIATRSQNLMNCRHRAGARSKYKGVSWKSETGKWCATICLNGKNKYLGYFHDEEDARLAYIEAAKQHFGEFARFA